VALFHISYLLACHSHTYPPRGGRYAPARPARRAAAACLAELSGVEWTQWSVDGRSVVGRRRPLRLRQAAPSSRRRTVSARSPRRDGLSLAKTRHGTARAPGLHSSRRAGQGAGWLAGSTFYECFKSHRQPGLPSSRLDSRPRHCISKYHPLRSACYHANDQSTRSPSSEYIRCSKPGAIQQETFNHRKFLLFQQQITYPLHAQLVKKFWDQKRLNIK